MDCTCFESFCFARTGLHGEPDFASISRWSTGSFFSNPNSRTYTTPEGKLEALHTRFRDHTIALFDKHGMKSVGYWVPSSPPKSKNTLIYVLKHKSREKAAESWKAFIADPVWQKAFQESRKEGPLLAKAPESVFMKATDYSPKTKNESGTGLPPSYELRIYKTHPGKLAALDARFRDHTVKLFTRHGITNVAYWHPLDEAGSKDTLIYIVRHNSKESASKSWSNFGKDPDWKKAAAASRADGPILRERPFSIYMKATDYSAIR